MAVNLLEILAECGLSELSDEDKKDLASHLMLLLEQRVGTVIASRLSNTQIEQFERLLEDSNDEASLAWMRATIPDYETVVAKEVEPLKKELQARRQEILDAVGLGSTA